jgi:DNA-binding response OmpR family regulator
VVADDQAGVRAILAVTLESRGVEVVQAANGDEAWGLVQRLRPAVAVLDVMMPGRDGLDLTRAIRADPELAATRVVIVSAKGAEEDVRDGLMAGADAYLAKPFSPSALVAAVERALGDVAPPG